MVKDENGLQSISEIRPTVIKPRRKQLSLIEERLVSLPLDEKQASILYQHSVLCQTSMPYRNPGAAIRTWQRRNGAVHLLIQAGQVLDPSIGDFVEMGLPFGTKPRLVLYHLNAESLRTQSPVVELEDSLTAFVSRTLGLDPKGRNIRTVKEQLSRLAGADFRLGISRDGRAITIKGTVIKGLELWSPRNPRQKTLWPTIIQFSSDYFESLMQHAVPLNLCTGRADPIVDRPVVVGPVRRETPDGSLDLVEQIRQGGGVVPAARREFGRHNEPLVIHSDVQLSPVPAFLGCLVLVRIPFAATQDLEPRGIDDQVDRAVVGSG